MTNVAEVVSKLAGWKGYAAAALAGAVFVGASVGTVQGWRYGLQIADLKAEKAVGRADANAVALSSLTSDIKTISEATTRAALVAPSLTAEVGKLSKALKNANPLPAGCRPDDVRVRNLTDSVRATNRAPAGQPSR